MASIWSSGTRLLLSVADMSLDQHARCLGSLFVVLAAKVSSGQQVCFLGSRCVFSAEDASSEHLIDRLDIRSIPATIFIFT